MAKFLETSSFFLLNFGLMQSFSEDRRNYRKLMNTHGLYCQIRDEYANLVNVQSLDTKAHETEFKNLHQLLFCEEITDIGQVAYSLWM